MQSEQISDPGSTYTIPKGHAPFLGSRFLARSMRSRLPPHRISPYSHSGALFADKPHTPAPHDGEISK